MSRGGGGAAWKCLKEMVAEWGCSRVGVLVLYFNPSTGVYWWWVAGTVELREFQKGHPTAVELFAGGYESFVERAVWIIGAGLERQVNDGI
jgi:hypothetical protein